METGTNYSNIYKYLSEKGVTLVAVSKTKPVEAILAIYNEGQRIFGENKVQEMADKYEELPKDIAWHLIGHLQTNKVKYIAPFVSLIHSVDSFKLLQEIDRQAKKHNRVIPVLLQIYIANEETKFGLSRDECRELLKDKELLSLKNISIIGLMGMATNTENEQQVKNEFLSLKQFFEELKSNAIFPDPSKAILSMGMSGDYKLAIEAGSNMVRIGSLIFGDRK
jgi:pyridoxal phosphate enzyme (YggS family)